ncbi:MAG: sporulation protein YqfD [Oscillospiraceae bacterium]|nr:sporulation protein YqfD [Oscillospiraceae bacterium]
MKSEKRSDLFFGTVGFSGIGGFQENFATALLESDIPVRRLCFSGAEISGEVSPFDYYRTASLARKSGVRIRAGKRRGLYFTLYKYRTRSGLYAGLLAFILLISIFQTRVLDIKYDGEAVPTEINPILEECGIKIGTSISDINFSLAEQRIMLEVPGCAWADVSREGFRLKVKVYKGIDVPEIEGTNPRNIVASRSAVIVSQTVRKGGSVVTDGSGVNAGDLLVSGVVHDGGDSVMFIHSDAEIIGEFTETKEFFVPYRETVRRAEGKQKRFDYLIFGDDEYPLFFGRAFAEDSLYSEETRLILNGNVKIRTAIFTEYVQREIERSPEACVSELKKQIELFEENFYNDFEIIASNERYYPQEDGIRVVVDFTLRGDIAKPVDIEMPD